MEAATLTARLPIPFKLRPGALEVAEKALLMGFRSEAGVPAWLAVAGILILFTLALTWMAVIPSLSATSADGASAFAYPLIFLPFSRRIA